MKFIKLNIQLFASDSVSKNVYAPASSTYPYKFTLSFNENDTDLDVNTSNVTIKGKIYGKNIGYSSTNKTKFAIYWYDNNENKDGKLVKEITLSKLTKGTSKEISATIDVKHLADGTLKGKAKLLFTKDSGSFVPPTTSLYTSEKELTTIPRANDITATDTDIGSTCMISIYKAVDTFTTTLEYDFLGLKGTIVDKTNRDTYGWSIPNEFYNKIPDKPFATCKIIATTYNGEKLLGSKETTFRVTANKELCKPTLDATIIDILPKTKALTGNDKTIVLNASTIQITYNGVAKNGATLKSITLNDKVLSLTNNKIVIERPNVETFTFVITDSRGYPNIIVLRPTVIKYSQPSIKATFARVNPTNGEIKVNYTGNWFNGSFGAKKNVLSVKYNYAIASDKPSYSTPLPLNPTISGNTYNQETTLTDINGRTDGFDYKNAYDFQITVEDSLSSLTNDHRVYQGIPVYWWNKETFNVEGDLYVKGKQIMSNEIPIGSPFFTIVDKSPSEILGYGTWERTATGRAIVGYDENDADFNQVGKLLGSKELQAHTHTGTTNENGLHKHKLGGELKALSSGTSSAKPRGFSSGVLNTTYDTDEVGNHTHTFTTDSAGNGNSGNIQPSMVWFIWIRTA